MKTAYVFSDSHGSLSAMEQALKDAKAGDAVIFLGDVNRDIVAVRNLFPLPSYYIVEGNNEWDDRGTFCTDLEFTLEGVKILACHGHTHGVRSGANALAADARKRGCSLALYGHTHCAAMKSIGGIITLNPGSCGYFRTSYCRLELEDGHFGAYFCKGDGTEFVL